MGTCVFWKLEWKETRGWNYELYAMNFAVKGERERKQISTSYAEWNTTTETQKKHMGITTDA